MTLIPILLIPILLTSTSPALTARPARSHSESSETRSNQEKSTFKQIDNESSPIATVNGVEIPLEKFDRLYEQRVDRLRQRGSEISLQDAVNIKSAIARLLIDELLIEQAAQKQGIRIPDAEVDRSIQQLATTFSSQQSFQRFVADSLGGEPRMREVVRVRLSLQRLAGIEPNKPVSSDEAVEFYNQHRSSFESPAHLVVLDIAFPVPANAPTSIDYAQHKKAEAALAAARQPNASFGALARQLSEGNRASVGGNLGRVTQESTDPILWRTLVAMTPGQISEVTKASDGYHVLKLIANNPAGTNSFEKVLPKIETSIRAKREFAKIAKLMSALRQSAKIENHLERRNIYTSK